MTKISAIRCFYVAVETDCGRINAIGLVRVGRDRCSTDEINTEVLYCAHWSKYFVILYKYYTTRMRITPDLHCVSYLHDLKRETELQSNQIK